MKVIYQECMLVRVYVIGQHIALLDDNALCYVRSSTRFNFYARPLLSVELFHTVNILSHLHISYQSLRKMIAK